MKCGVCLYPDFLSKEEISSKLATLHKNNIKYIFTSIQLEDLNFDNTNSDWSHFTFFFEECRKNGINLSVDVSKDSIGKFGVTDITNLEQVKELGIHSLRIDGGYNHKELAAFTTNKQNIKIEINASMTKNLDGLLKLIKDTGNSEWKS